LRRFSISLHFFSPRAYSFIIEKFNSVLPHPRTLSKWYASVNAEPGIWKEALNTLKLKCDDTANPVYCALIMDEVAIRKHVEWDGYKYHGYVDFGAQLNNESLEMATECLVFLLVSITESWKLPVTYFFFLSSMQKGNLVEQCLEQIRSTGIKVVNLSFDGCPLNMTMVKNFGCDLRISSLKTNFTLPNHLPINIIPDPAHMIKLIRNTFGEKRVFIDFEGKKIDFVFIEKLLILQETEHFHLANKLKNQHVFFSKMKMKVKFATQLLSKSVTDALFFFKNNLNLKDFEDCDCTIHFIRIINDAFDVLNSRNVKSTGKKKSAL